MADTIYRGTGRRKSSVARVIIQPGSGRIVVNGRDVTNYFPVEIVRQHALSPLALTQLSGRLDVRVLVNGGGTSGQAGAIRHGLARALILYDAGLRDQGDEMALRSAHLASGLPVPNQHQRPCAIRIALSEGRAMAGGPGHSCPLDLPVNQVAFSGAQTRRYAANGFGLRIHVVGRRQHPSTGTVRSTIRRRRNRGTVPRRAPQTGSGVRSPHRYGFALITIQTGQSL